MWPMCDNGSRLNWARAQSYCVNYRGGGYTDWRMPKGNELESLYATGAHKNLINITGSNIWTDKKFDSTVVFFSTSSGRAGFEMKQSGDWTCCRALPVRFVK
jgi:hypothetical protein